LKSSFAPKFSVLRLAARLAALQAKLLPFIEPYRSELHGLPHLREVSLLAGFLADAEGRDVEPAMVAGFLHDCERRHDGGGNEHALDSAATARRLVPRLFAHLDAAAIARAVKLHADGLTTRDHPDAALWDADRLTLVRLGYRVDSRLLSTRCARRLAKDGTLGALRDSAAAAARVV
jgi:HD superfamily phosphodiesterase